MIPWRRWWARGKWDLERFGLLPGAAASRVARGERPRVLAISLPKAGTHLLERAICLHPDLHRRLLPTVHDANIGRRGELDGVLAGLRPGQAVFAHLRYTDERLRAIRRHGARLVFSIRDPRDVVVSQAHYAIANRRHPHHQLFSSRESLRGRIELAILGSHRAGLPSLQQRLRHYAGWLDVGCPVVRFEALVGGMGGGDDLAQLELLRRLFDSLGLRSDETILQQLAARLFFEASPTFRRGRIGQWRDHLDDELVGLIEATAGDELRRYGY